MKKKLEIDAPNQSSNEVDELMVSEPDQDIIIDPSEPTLQSEPQNDPSQEEEQNIFLNDL